MRYSKLFGKTVRDISKEAKLISHQLLYKAGFIRELVSGRYSILPLGFRVHDKIKKIIKEEMDAIGAQQIITPTLHPLELWKRTNRTTTMGATLMRLKDRHGAQFVLGATHEEVFVDLVQKFNLSEKDLPVILYQFSNKFRDELRARGGLVRVREFVMKDAYSFNESVESLDKSYQDMFDAYQRIFNRIGVPTIPVEADSGAIGGKFCHEFMYEDKDGEDTFVKCNSCDYAANTEKAEFIRDDVNTKEEIKPFKMIDQPEWVETMDDNVKHYKLPKSHFLKNVVYKNEREEIIIGVLRGDLEVNEIKLTKASDSAQLTVATEEDLKKLGTKSGWVHSWGHRGCRYIGDLSLTTVHNFIGGQKEKTTDSFNVNYDRDFTCEKLADIALAGEGFICPKCKKGKLKLHRGIEMGHVFRLDYYYSKPMEAYFVTKTGEKKNFLMGCYGIGLERAMAAVVEEHNDNKGIIWPESVAPFLVYLIGVDQEKKEVVEFTEEIYKRLSNNSIEVLYDDRIDVSAGVKFADCDLIGVPYRAVVSQKTVKEGKIEIKKRTDSKVELVSKEELASRITKLQ